MSSVFQNYAIYRLRAFTRLASAFHKERIPVLNFTELDTDNTDLDVSLRLRRTFADLKSEGSSGPGEHSAGMALIAWLADVINCMQILWASQLVLSAHTGLQNAQARIGKQLSVLCRAEDHTRQVGA